MSRAATTSDVFNAIAESRRREILELLAGQERPVGDIVNLLGLISFRLYVLLKGFKICKQFQNSFIRNEALPNFSYQLEIDVCKVPGQEKDDLFGWQTQCQ